MMPSLITSHAPVTGHVGYATDNLLNELSRHLASSTTHARRMSRSTHSQRPASSMRISKPNSANNSPQSSLMNARRRTWVGEGHHSRGPPPIVDYVPTPAADLFAASSPDMMGRPDRPLSWHPSSSQPVSQMPSQPVSQMPSQPTPAPLHSLHVHHHYQYPAPRVNDGDFYSPYLDFPPTPAAYSGYTSPASALSPLSLPYTNTTTGHLEASCAAADAASFLPHAAWPSLPPSQAASAALSLCLPPAPLALHQHQPPFTYMPRNPFARTPPTPDNLFVADAPPAYKLAPEEAIPLQPLEAAAAARDDEADGEILYGMGLYDAPDTRDAAAAQQPQQPQPQPPWQPQWHRTTVTALLGGPATVPEPKGRGLKLEDAWEPPESDEEGEDDDPDADGEEEEEAAEAE